LRVHLTVLLVCFWLSGCVDARTATPVAGPMLDALEARLARTTPPLATHLSPVGLYWEDGVLWTWGHAATRQHGLVDGQVVRQREGPAYTRACSVGPARTVCVGDSVIAVRGELPMKLPDHRGWRGVVDGRSGLALLDGTDELLRLEGAPPLATGPTPLAMGPLDSGRIWLSSGQAPFLTIINPALRTVRAAPGLVAPIRAATWDASRSLLWTVGPANRLVRRDTGPIKGLWSQAVARDSDLKVVRRIDLRQQGLVDATAIVSAGGRIAISATGSDAFWLEGVGRVPTGLGPHGLLVHDGQLAIAARLEDAIRIHRFDSGRLVSRVDLDDRPRAAPADLGQRLFFGDFLWRLPTGQGMTCASCHWDAGTDHRVHPGFHQRREEATRPLGGIRDVLPIFSTGGALSLRAAVEGLFRSLDPRLWSGGGRYWDYDISMSVKGNRRVTLSAAQARAALLEYLMRLPRRAPARSTGDPLGRTLFARDCADCHEPVSRSRPRGFAHSDLGPDITPNGNRLTPLLDLGRGGPFGVAGNVPTLDALLQRHPKAADYSPAQRRALRRYLLTL
jgi:hypothetical protein